MSAFLVRSTANYLETIRSYPHFSSWIPITLAKNLNCDSRFWPDVEIMYEPPRFIPKECRGMHSPVFPK